MHNHDINSQSEGDPNHAPSLRRPKEYDYDLDLRSDSMFNNPYGLNFMRLAFGIQDVKSFVADHEHYSYLDYYDEIRLQQNKNWAQKEVEAGVKLAKQGQFKEAMKKYQSALDTDPQNTDALVAKGAAFFNANMISDAIEAFNQALDIQPRHQNAKKYLDIAMNAQQVSKKQSLLAGSENDSEQQLDKKEPPSQFHTESVTKILKTMLKEDKSKKKKDKTKKGHDKKHKSKKKKKDKREKDKKKKRKHHHTQNEEDSDSGRARDKKKQKK